MIVKCPNCRAPMSSVAPECPSCGMERGEISEEQAYEVQRRRLRDRIYRLKMSSYAAISLLLVAAGWYFWEASDIDMTPSVGPIFLVAVGAAAYLVVRGLLFMTKREMKNLRQG